MFNAVEPEFRRLRRGVFGGLQELGRNSIARARVGVTAVIAD